MFVRLDARCHPCSADRASDLSFSRSTLMMDGGAVSVGIRTVAATIIRMPNTLPATVPGTAGCVAACRCCPLPPLSSFSMLFLLLFRLVVLCHSPDGRPSTAGSLNRSLRASVMTAGGGPPSHRNAFSLQVVWCTVTAKMETKVVCDDRGVPVEREVSMVSPDMHKVGVCVSLSVILSVPVAFRICHCHAVILSFGHSVVRSFCLCYSVPVPVCALLR